MLVIEPEKSKSAYWKEIWQYRELIFFLTWKNLLVRYKQTVVGLFWHFLKPLMILLALSVVFGRIANLDNKQNYPYLLLVMTGLLPWQFFSTALSDCSESLVVNYQVITKIYFPRIILPMTSLFVIGIDFLISLSLLIAIMCYYHYVPPPTVFFFPLFIILLFLLSFGFGIWAAAINVRYRDCRQLIPFFIQFGLYVSPVGYSSHIVPENWRLLFHLNPIAGIIDGFRFCIIGYEESLVFSELVVSFTMLFIILLSGIAYYRRVENYFADII